MTVMMWKKKERVRKRLKPMLRRNSRDPLRIHPAKPLTPAVSAPAHTTATAVTSINCSGRPNIWCMDTPVADGNRSPKYFFRTAPTFR